MHEQGEQKGLRERGRGHQHLRREPNLSNSDIQRARELQADWAHEGLATGAEQEKFARVSGARARAQQAAEAVFAPPPPSTAAPGPRTAAAFAPAPPAPPPPPLPPPDATLVPHFSGWLAPLQSFTSLLSLV